MAEKMVMVRVDQGTDDALKKAAKQTVRSRNGLIQYVLKEWLMKNGYLTDSKKEEVK